MECGQQLPGNNALQDGSPYYKMDLDANNIPNTSPLLAFATKQDFMPGGQFDAICEKVDLFNGGLTGCGDLANVDYRAVEFFPTVQGNKHSFAYWFDDTEIGNDESAVDKLAIAFLCGHLDASCVP